MILATYLDKDEYKCRERDDGNDQSNIPCKERIDVDAACCHRMFTILAFCWINRRGSSRNPLGNPNTLWAWERALQKIMLFLMVNKHRRKSKYHKNITWWPVQQHHKSTFRKVRLEIFGRFHASATPGSETRAWRGIQQWEIQETWRNWSQWLIDIVKRDYKTR